MKISLALLTLLVLVLVGAMGAAQDDNNVVYSNGAPRKNVDALFINESNVTSDTFTVSSNDTKISGLNFWAWLAPGDVLQTVEVSITTAEFGGDSFFNAQVHFTQSDCSLNPQGYNVCLESSTFAGPTLSSGSYWLNLGSAVGTFPKDSSPIKWDENSGASEASNNLLGTIPSEAFTVFGSVTSTGTTPEPSSILLFASGMLGLIVLIRRA